MKIPGRVVEWHESIDTTMRRAAELAAAGCASGTIVGADLQTAGQGRQGHSWHSPAGLGLYFTVVLRLPLEPRAIPVVTLALGLATADAVRLVSGVQCDLRWPNDVMVDDRKLGGILTQYQDGAILAGIGLNVNQAEFPSDLAHLATSLRIESGRDQRRDSLLATTAACIDSQNRILTTGGVTPILRLFAASSSYVEGKRVIVDETRGVTAGLTQDGFLKLRKDDGEVITIYAGGVRPDAAGN